LSFATATFVQPAFFIAIRSAAAWIESIGTIRR
jgi:hypothetical protein